MDYRLTETATFDFITSSATGAAVDADATPTFEVFEDTTDTALTLTTSSVAKRTGKTGNYRISFTIASADGFEEDKTYNVVASATVGGVACKAVVGTFVVRAATAGGGGATLAEIEASTVLAKEATVAAIPAATLGEIEASAVLAKEATVESIPAATWAHEVASGFSAMKILRAALAWFAGRRQGGAPWAGARTFERPDKPGTTAISLPVTDQYGNTSGNATLNLED